MNPENMKKGECADARKLIRSQLTNWALAGGNSRIIDQRDNGTNNGRRC